jgi:acetoin:2,6-dichlorophenolindophenol oxidoreductase subunit alpha
MKTTYRTKEEVEKWKERDPLDIWAEYLIRASICSAEDIERMKREIDEQISEGVEYARQSPTPSPTDALEYMYAVNYPYTPAKGAEQ